MLKSKIFIPLVSRGALQVLLSPPFFRPSTHIDSRPQGPPRPSSSSFSFFLPLTALHSSLPTVAQRMATLATDSACDNMYLEFVLALELRERSSLDKIFPLMLGDKDDATGKYGRFTFRGANPCYPTKWPEVAVESVDAKLRERLDDMELGMPLVDAMTVTDVLAGVMKYQGAYIEGDLEDALKVIIENKIVHMRRSHDKAVHDALEAENKAASQAASQAAGTGGSATGKSPKIHLIQILRPHSPALNRPRGFEQSIRQGRLPMINVGDNHKISDILLVHSKVKNVRLLALSVAEGSMWAIITKFLIFSWFMKK